MQRRDVASTGKEGEEKGKEVGGDREGKECRRGGGGAEKGGGGGEGGGRGGKGPHLLSH